MRTGLQTVSYGSIDKYLIEETPTELHRNFSSFEVFEGNRILVKRGISRNGRIVVRVESKSFSFNNNVHCIRFIRDNSVVMKSIGAILLSSLAKYYFYLTCSGWGLWHDEVQLDELRRFPIPDVLECEQTRKLSLLMDEVKEYGDFTLNSQKLLGERDFDGIVRDIDDIVFKLYQLTEDEKSFVIDMCSYGLDLFYKKINSYALNPSPPLPDKSYGTESSLSEKTHFICSYIRRIISPLNMHLASAGAELEWRVYRSDGIISVMFLTKYVNDPIEIGIEDKADWRAALSEFGKLSVQRVTDDIYIDRSFIGVSENCIVVVKKDELRNWSTSAAVKDLNSVLLKMLDNKRAREDGNV